MCDFHLNLFPLDLNEFFFLILFLKSPLSNMNYFKNFFYKLGIFNFKNLFKFNLNNSSKMEVFSLSFSLSFETKSSYINFFFLYETQNIDFLIECLFYFYLTVFDMIFVYISILKINEGRSFSSDFFFQLFFLEFPKTFIIKNIKTKQKT